MIPVKQLYHVFRDAWQDEYEYLKEYGLFAANESWWLAGRGDWEGWHREFDKIEEDGMVVYYSQDRIVLKFTVSYSRPTPSEYKYLSIPREFADKALVLGYLP